MGFVKSMQEIMGNIRPTADFYDAEMLSVFWETKPEIAAKLIPAPMEPAENPIAMAFTAYYPSTNFDVVYRESALFLRARFKEEEGNYCLSMPVTSDIAMAAGREVFGYPKKMAEIHFNREGNTVNGWTERRGIRFMEMSANLDGEFNVPEFMTYMQGADPQPDGSMNTVSFNFKHFPSPEGEGFDYPPRLVRQETTLRPKEIMIGKGDITFKPSSYDPWSEVDVVRMLGATYMRGDNSMLGGKVVAEGEFLSFLPYAFLKWDMK